jgi:carboxylesterase type B
MIDADSKGNAANPLLATAHVESGRLRGVASADGSVIVFKGIPYAAPPVGEPSTAVRSPTTWQDDARRSAARSRAPGRRDGR